VVYVATAAAVDQEMAERIAHHRARRPAGWRTVEAQTALAAQVGNLGSVRTVLVEDLTLLLSNHMQREASASGAESKTVEEVQALLALQVNVVLVSNEVGMGLVPPYPLGRQFRDALGRVNQAAAAGSSEVYFVVAGLSLRMK
jgi:adenosylcobinamide kinase / adenosylcobinamide-phosphate guanylyltransferase